MTQLFHVDISEVTYLYQLSVQLFLQFLKQLENARQQQVMQSELCNFRTVLSPWLMTINTIFVGMFPSLFLTVCHPWGDTTVIVDYSLVCSLILPSSFHFFYSRLCFSFSAHSIRCIAFWILILQFLRGYCQSLRKWVLLFSQYFSSRPEALVALNCEPYDCYLS